PTAGECGHESKAPLGWSQLKIPDSKRRPDSTGHSENAGEWIADWVHGELPPQPFRLGLQMSDGPTIPPTVRGTVVHRQDGIGDRMPSSGYAENLSSLFVRPLPPKPRLRSGGS